MFNSETFRTAITQVRAHPLRSILTTLGIIIGIGMVILIAGILEGFRLSMEGDLNRLGANTFQVQRYPNSGGFRDPDDRHHRRILKADLADAIRERAPSVKFVGAENWMPGQSIAYRSKKTNLNISVAGATPEFAPNNGYFIDGGRFVTDRDLMNSRQVAVIGMDVVDALFENEYPVGRTIRIKGQKFSVVGIFERQGSSTFGQSRDNLVALPLTAWQMLYGRNHSVNLTIMAKEAALFEQAQEEVIGIMRKERKVPPGEEEDFYMYSNESLTDQFNSVAQVIQFAGAAFGIISLIVGGFGVANVMLVSVTERTREIGIRKAVGALRRDIRKQFLIEATLLCLMGGILGMGGGILLTWVISAFSGMPFGVPLWSVIVAVTCTIVVGLIAGVYPAFKASQLAPIEALRYE